MEHNPHPARHASTAIAVVLAFTATPLLAQEAAPPVIPPVTATVDAPATTSATPPLTQPEAITDPSATVTTPQTGAAASPPFNASTVTPATQAPTVVTQSNPVVQPVPEPSTEAVEPATANEATAPTSTSAAPAPAARSAPAAAADASAAPVRSTTPIDTAAADAPEAATLPGETADLAPLSAPSVQPVAQAAPEPAAANAVDADGGDGALAGTIGLLALLGLGAGGIALFRRRRRTARAVPVAKSEPLAHNGDAAPHPYVSPKIDNPPADTPLAGTAATGGATRGWAQATPLPARRPVTASATAGGLANAGAAVVLPRDMPASFEERDRLIKQMVAAKPDRANPFVSPRARRKRARLILQSLGRKFQNGHSWIDLSQYPQNWPTLARGSSSVAA
ncbi:conserved hypothetical protein [Altererythrobacter sp. B11]|uniref:hypothetical protein n=1 Tax=Altererythrobacter sp. B11 TaxID=2060312 RepID=UPI000DC6DF4E|nr:hypothetical protein [Altererythrobacter sp. B11]BBC73690.1 conserved hypothetical protein [Altererythrobacter sp. B11]